MLFLCSIIKLLWIFFCKFVLYFSEYSIAILLVWPEVIACEFSTESYTSSFLFLEPPVLPGLLLVFAAGFLFCWDGFLRAGNSPLQRCIMDNYMANYTNHLYNSNDNKVISIQRIYYDLKKNKVTLIILIKTSFQILQRF